MLAHHQLSAVEAQNDVAVVALEIDRIERLAARRARWRF
jgi:hypothetical protein